MKVLPMDSMLAVALNSMSDGLDTVIVALNFELSGDAPPAELMLIPAGLRVEGRDGRAWYNRNPQGVVDFFRARGLKIPIDIEHATELKAPRGEPAPAMAWGFDLEARPDGSIWAKTEWNPRGVELWTNREYSYYSPAIIYDRRTMDIVGIKSVGLTNTPNFQIPALNHEGAPQGGLLMTLEELLSVLGLPAGTSFAAALNHIAQMKANLAAALNRAETPPLDRFVPKADYDLAVNRASEAEGKLAAHAKEVLETAINTEIDAALKAGKITPATKDYHVAQCRQEGGLERFKAFVAAAPTVAADSGLDGKKPEDGATALNAEEAKIAAMFGNSAEDIKKYGA
ncbi:phage protease [Geobacter anodireducens]|uniref:Mu-like prophage I protein n=1 Tax=Geobacter anodireducens TaxID=1340425 RepID=A0ABR9NXH7_9BACT|nr:phage protease [Geobacter anodireducens]MBE2888954.1 hypothetical protein [Geobacter anodireducens]